jgi:hypothetical protein
VHKLIEAEHSHASAAEHAKAQLAKRRAKDRAAK